MLQFILETDRLLIRPVREEDREAFLSLRIATSEVAAAYTILPGLKDSEWEYDLKGEDTLNLSVFLKETDTFAASASVQNYREDTIDLGFEVAEAYRGRGIGTEIVRSLLGKVHELFPGTPVRIRMRKDNDASRRVAEKCGGTLAGCEDTFFTKSMKALQARAAKNGSPFPKGENREEILALMKQGENGVLIYRMP